MTITGKQIVPKNPPPAQEEAAPEAPLDREESESENEVEEEQHEEPTERNSSLQAFDVEENTPI